MPTTQLFTPEKTFFLSRFQIFPYKKNAVFFVNLKLTPEKCFTHTILSIKNHIVAKDPKVVKVSKVVKVLKVVKDHKVSIGS